MQHRSAVAALAACACLVMGLSAAKATVNETKETPVQVAPGYALKPVVNELTAPAGIAVSDQGELYVVESGAEDTPPAVLRLGPGRQRAKIATDFPALITGLTWQKGRLYVTYAGGVSVLDPATGQHHPILSKLPAKGDHPNHGLTFGPDGKIYFGIGTATNAGVAGPDNIQRGWVSTSPEFHDIPCKPVQLRGTNFTVPNPLTPDPHDMAATGAFVPFGKTTARGQVIPGALPCSGAILRAEPDGTQLELVAWGLRNPVGVAFSPDGQLVATNQGFAHRGARPVTRDADYLYLITPGRWYGWPDFMGGRPAPFSPLLTTPPEQPPPPTATFDPGSGANGLIFPPASFGLQGDALVALGGPTTEPEAPDTVPPGHMIARVRLQTGQVVPFAWNRPGAKRALERPLAFSAGPAGEIYVVDYGQIRTGSKGSEAVPGTGAVWKLVRTGQTSSPAAISWRWALVGAVLSIAGVRLLARE